MNKPLKIPLTDQSILLPPLVRSDLDFMRPFALQRNGASNCTDALLSLIGIRLSPAPSCETSHAGLTFPRHIGAEPASFALSHVVPKKQHGCCGGCRWRPFWQADFFSNSLESIVEWVAKPPPPKILDPGLTRQESGRRKNAVLQPGHHQMGVLDQTSIGALRLASRHGNCDCAHAVSQVEPFLCPELGYVLVWRHTAGWKGFALPSSSYIVSLAWLTRWTSFERSPNASLCLEMPDSNLKNVPIQWPSSEKHQFSSENLTISLIRHTKPITFRFCLPTCERLCPSGQRSPGVCVCVCMCVCVRKTGVEDAQWSSTTSDTQQETCVGGFCMRYWPKQIHCKFWSFQCVTPSYVTRFFFFFWSITPTFKQCLENAGQTAYVLSQNQWLTIWTTWLVHSLQDTDIRMRFRSSRDRPSDFARETDSGNSFCPNVLCSVSIFLLDYTECLLCVGCKQAWTFVSSTTPGSSIYSDRNIIKRWNGTRWMGLHRGIWNTARPFLLASLSLLRTFVLWTKRDRATRREHKLSLRAVLRCGQKTKLFLCFAQEPKTGMRRKLFAPESAVPTRVTVALMGRQAWRGEWRDGSPVSKASTAPWQTCWIFNEVLSKMAEGAIQA